jgi:hypothetical protein
LAFVVLLDGGGDDVGVLLHEPSVEGRHSHDGLLPKLTRSESLAGTARLEVDGVYGLSQCIVS